MKVGDLVTYLQRPDLAAHPTPYGRLGTIVRQCPVDFRFEVYWWGSENKVWYEEKGLDNPSLDESR